MDDNDDSDLLCWEDFKHTPGIYNYDKDVGGTYIVVGKAAGIEYPVGSPDCNSAANGYMWLMVNPVTGKLNRCEALFDGHMGPRNKCWRKVENVELRLILKVD